MTNSSVQQKLFALGLTFLLMTGCVHHPQIQKQELPSRLEKAKFTIPLGEHMKFSIRLLGVELGAADVWVKEIVKVRDRDAYHIVVKVRSKKWVDLIYPVDDEHHSYIDAEHFHSLRYDRRGRQGDYRVDEVIDYDQVNHKARYESRRSGDIKEMLIPKDVHDQVSCTFWFRVQPMKPGDKIEIPINIDEKNWKLEVEVQAIEELNIDGFGKIHAIRAEPFARFQGLFVRRGRAWGWMSADERRIPLLMKTRIPVLGAINMVLVEYELGDYKVRA
ncbi:MAG: DUF3108 domain-containing protein [Candidatus Omnitrophica bacterium]|nr:DUF3108 domain-containing protein [Candidatus Omnitrophota bacterium]